MARGGGRCPAGGQQGMYFVRGPANQVTQVVIENDRGPPPLFAVIQGALRDRATEHLLQAQGLGAELHPVGVVTLRPAALVFHRQGLPGPVLLAMELDHIGKTDQAKAQGADGHIVLHPQGAA